MSLKKGEHPGAPSGAHLKKGSFAALKSLLTRWKARRPVHATEDHIRSILLVRNARDEVLGVNLFSDPAWDLLLELYAAHLSRRKMSLADLHVATDTPQSTIARWIAALEKADLVQRFVDPSQPATVFISLTADGASKMQHLADHWASAFVSI